MICVDIDERRVERLRSGEIPIYEPGLADVVQAVRDRPYRVCFDDANPCALCRFFTVKSGNQFLAYSAAAHGVKLMVGHIERFNPAVTEIKRRLSAGELGRIFQVHARRLSPFPGRISDVGVILDLASHDIDVMHHLLGSDVERVFAETEQKAHAMCEDLVSALIRFSNGVIGLLDVNWLTPAKRRQLVVVGSEGKGLSRLVTETCDAIVSIPIDSAMESLNASMAVGISLYEVSRRRGA